MGVALGVLSVLGLRDWLLLCVPPATPVSSVHAASLALGASLELPFLASNAVIFVLDEGIEVNEVRGPAQLAPGGFPSAAATAAWISATEYSEALFVLARRERGAFTYFMLFPWLVALLWKLLTECSLLLPSLA